MDEPHLRTRIKFQMSQKKKILLIGSNGQLGSDLNKLLTNQELISIFSLTHTEISVDNKDSLQKNFLSIKPDIVINTAAYHKVDEVESNPEKAFLINAIAQKHLATLCAQNKSTLVYISTDYVFGGDKQRIKPFNETDLPDPINVYGISKLAGEKFVTNYCPKHFVIRTAALFGAAGSSGKGGNFVETMLRLAREQGFVKVVNDQVTTPTHTADLAKQILCLIQTNHYGLYHATSEGQSTWFEFAREILKQCNIKVKVYPVKSSAFPTLATRPGFSVLENSSLKKLKLNLMPNWKKSLNDYLKVKGYLN